MLLFLLGYGVSDVWALNCLFKGMKRPKPNTTSPNKSTGLFYYVNLTALAVTGPAALSAYVFACWALTANVGLTRAFPWSTGPLSNWMVWFGLALLLNLVASSSNREIEVGEVGHAELPVSEPLFTASGRVLQLTGKER